MPMDKGDFVAEDDWICFQHEGRLPIKLYRAIDASYAKQAAACLQRLNTFAQEAEKLVGDLKYQLQICTDERDFARRKEHEKHDACYAEIQRLQSALLEEQASNEANHI